MGLITIEAKDEDLTFEDFLKAITSRARVTRQISKISCILGISQWDVYFLVVFCYHKYCMYSHKKKKKKLYI